MKKILLLLTLSLSLYGNLFYTNHMNTARCEKAKDMYIKHKELINLKLKSKDTRSTIRYIYKALDDLDNAQVYCEATPAQIKAADNQRSTLYIMLNLLGDK